MPVKCVWIFQKIQSSALHHAVVCAAWNRFWWSTSQLIIAPLLGRSCVWSRRRLYAPHALGGSERTLGAKTQVLNYQAQIELALAWFRTYAASAGRVEGVGGVFIPQGQHTQDAHNAGGRDGGASASLSPIFIRAIKIMKRDRRRRTNSVCVVITVCNRVVRDSSSAPEFDVREILLHCRWWLRWAQFDPWVCAMYSQEL